MVTEHSFDHVRIIPINPSLLFSHSVIFDSLQPHGLQHARICCPSQSPRACSKSCPLSWWYHPTISSSVVPFSSCLQSFPASGSFLMSQVFESGGQVLELQLQHQSFQWISQWIDCFDLLEVQGTLKHLFQRHSWKHQFFCILPSLWSNSHIHICAVLFLVTQSCLILCDPMDHSRQAPLSVGILQARILESVAMPHSTSIYVYWKNHSFDYKESNFQKKTKVGEKQFHFQ